MLADPAENPSEINQGPDDRIQTALRGLVLAPDLPQVWAGLALLLYRMGQKRASGLMLYRASLLNPADWNVVLSLGSLLAEFGLHRDSLDQFSRIPADAPVYAFSLTRQASCHLALEDYQAAETILHALLAQNEDRADLCAMMADALIGLGRSDEARAFQRRAMAANGGSLTLPAKGAAEAHILFLCSTKGADLPIDYIFDNRRFDFTFVYPDLAQSAQTLGADIIFNAIADPDLGADEFDSVEKFAVRADLPLLNPPQNLPKTRRDHLAQLVAGIDGLLVPNTIRLSANQISGLAVFEGDKLIRTAGTHGGDALERISNLDQLKDFCARHKSEYYYLTDYVDYRSEDGWFRKYRFIFINRQVHPFHLAIMDHWKIHYWRAGMVNDAWKCAEEERFMRNAASTFPPAALTAVQQIAQRLDLDYAGLDCGLMPDGRVIIFETNAAMLTHLNDDPAHYPYKHELVPHLRDAMSAHVIAAARSGTCQSA
jgi:hypothetical protein